MNTQLDRPMIQAPTDDATRTYETLCYLDAYDAVLNCDYAFVAFKETDRGTGAWRVRIRSSQTPGAVFEQEMMRLKARETGAHGRPWFQWGFAFTPSDGDPRHIEFRVHVRDGKPMSVEMLVRLRLADHLPGPQRSLQFAWPA